MLLGTAADGSCFTRKTVVKKKTSLDRHSTMRPSQHLPSVRPKRTLIESMTESAGANWAHAISRSSPVVFRGAGWRASGLGEFAGLFDTSPLVINTSLPLVGNVFDGSSMARIVSATYDEFVRLVALCDEASFLVRMLRNSDGMAPAHLPGAAVDAILSHVRLESFGLSEKDHVRVHLWLGSSNTRSGWHFDDQDNLFFQCMGRKHALLGSPSEARRFYPRGKNHRNSRVDADDPDLSHFPSYAGLQLGEATLHPGDVLFIPKGWWHSLRALDVSASISCFYGSHLTWKHHVSVVASSGPRALSKLARDFIVHGVLGRPETNDLYTGVSTGASAYRAICRSMRRILRPLRTRRRDDTKV